MLAAAGVDGVEEVEVRSPRSKKLNNLAKNPSPPDEFEEVEVEVEEVEGAAELEPESKKFNILENKSSNELLVVLAAGVVAAGAGAGDAGATGWAAGEATGVEPATAEASTTSVWYTVTMGAAPAKWKNANKSTNKWLASLNIA